MPRISRYALVRQMAAMAILGIAALVSKPGIALAYGPPPPPPPTPVRGGYYCVVTSQTLGPAGQLIGPLRLTGMVARLGDSSGAFPAGAQITVTEPYASSSDCQGGPGIGNAGFAGYRAVGGVGILIQRNESAYRGTFRKPLALHLASRSITRSSLVVVWSGTRFVKVPHAVIGRGSASIRVDANSDLAVLTRVSTRHGPAAARAPEPGGEFLAAFFLTRPGSPLPGLGVVAPAWLAAFAARGHGP